MHYRRGGGLGLDGRERRRRRLVDQGRRNGRSGAPRLERARLWIGERSRGGLGLDGRERRRRRLVDQGRRNGRSGAPRLERARLWIGERSRDGLFCCDGLDLGHGLYDNRDLFRDGLRLQDDGLLDCRLFLGHGLDEHGLFDGHLFAGRLLGDRLGLGVALDGDLPLPQRLDDRWLRGLGLGRDAFSWRLCLGGGLAFDLAAERELLLPERFGQSCIGFGRVGLRSLGRLDGRFGLLVLLLTLEGDLLLPDGLVGHDLAPCDPQPSCERRLVLR